MKKFLSRLSVFILVLSITLGFGSREAFAYDEDTVTQVTQYYFQIWNETDFQQYIDIITDEAVLEQYTSWQELKDQIGAYEEESEVRITEEEGTIVVTLVEKYTNSDIHFVITFDEALAEEDPMNAILSIEAMLPQAGSGEAGMLKAGMNTLMGMGIVFLVLIFISVIIWLLKFVPALFERKQDTPVEIPVSAPVAVANVVQTENTELIAVITAAIEALRAEEHDDTENHGFVVRSIRRRHN